MVNDSTIFFSGSKYLSPSCPFPGTAFGIVWNEEVKKNQEFSNREVQCWVDAFHSRETYVLVRKHVLSLMNT